MKELKQFVIIAPAVLFSASAYWQQNDIVDIAAGSDAHTTLVAGVKGAGLVETLKSSRLFTVFAPVNEAFGKSPAGKRDFLLMSENKEILANFLTFHVVAGSLDS